MFTFVLYVSRHANPHVLFALFDEGLKFCQFWQSRVKAGNALNHVEVNLMLFGLFTISNRLHRQ